MGAFVFAILLVSLLLADQSSFVQAVVYSPGFDDGSGGSGGGWNSGTSSAGDPDCSTGVAGQGRFRGVCCPVQCGNTCGGPGCADLPGGRDSCCTGPIVAAGRSCVHHPPPCRLDTINPCTTTDTASQQDPLDVLVIGAGWSGLAAGSRLLASTTTNFCILEGRDVMGGRSRTLMSYFENGLPTELGSGWIYPGSNVFRIFQSAGLVTDVPTFFDLDSMGIYLKPDATTTGIYGPGGLLVGNSDQVIRGAYQNFIRYARSVARHDVSMHTIKESYLAQNSQQLSTLEKQAVDALVTSILHSEWGAYLTDADSSAMLDYLDYSYSINYVGIPGSGFKPALEYFAAPFANHISYNQQVIEIDRSGTNSNQLVKVTSMDRTTNTFSVRYARAVICTVSLGVLKHGDLKFVPSLPSTKTQAIQNMAFGNKNKCYLYWDAKTTAPGDLSWWPRGITDMQFIMQDEEYEGSNKEWTMFLNDQNHRGNENIYVLSAWIGGVHADAWEKRTDEETVQRVMGNLRKMFPTSNIPEPTKFFVTRWGSDPFTRGTYTYYKAGVDYGSGARALAQPVGNNLYFAGEATWPFGMGAPDAFSSGEAAVQSLAQSGVLSQQLPQPQPQPPGPTTPSQSVPDVIFVQTAPPTTASPTPDPTTTQPTPNLPTPQPTPDPTQSPATEEVATTSPTTALPTPDPTTPQPTPLPTPQPTPSQATEEAATPSPTTAFPTPVPTLSTEPEDTADWNFLDWLFGKPQPTSPTPTPSLRSPTNFPTTSSPTESPTIITVISSAEEESISVSGSVSASLCGRTGFPCGPGQDTGCCEGYICEASYSEFDEINDDVIRRCIEAR